MKTPLMHPIFLGSLLAVLLTTVSVARADTQETTVSALNPQNRAGIGLGYFKGNQSFGLKTCLKADSFQPAYSGGANSRLSFDRVKDSEALASSLGFGMDAQAHFGLFGSASMSADFLKQSSSSAFDDSVTYSNEIVLKDVLPRFSGKAKDNLTAAGLEAMGSNPRKADADFYDLCGDSVVKDVARGAKLFFTARFSFATESSRQEFHSKVDVSGNLGSLSAQFSSLSQSARESTKIKFSAYQVGGDVRRLATIFNVSGLQADKSAANVDSKEALALTHCSLAELENCNRVIEAAIRYGAHDFPAQVPNEYEPNSPVGAADLEYILAPWSEAGVNISSPQLTAQLAVDRRLLARLFDRQLDYINRLADLADHFPLTAEQVVENRQATTSVEDYIYEISQASGECYLNDRGLKPRALAERCHNAYQAVGVSTSRKVTDDSPVLHPVSPCDSSCDPTACVRNERLNAYECLRCERKLSDWYEGSMSVPVSGVKNKPYAGPTLSCQGMPRGATVAISASGTFGPLDFHPGGGRTWWVNLELESQTVQWAEQSGSWATAAISTAVTVPDNGTVVATLIPNHCQYAREHDTRFECDTIFQPDLTIKVEAAQRLHDLGRN